jgi:hypothetical protein
MISQLINRLIALEDWFNSRFGWFFTNGSKTDN